MYNVHVHMYIVYVCNLCNLYMTLHVFTMGTNIIMNIYMHTIHACVYMLYMYMYIVFCDYAGRSLVTEETASEDAPGRNAGAFVQALLDLRDTYNRFLLDSFTGDQQFKNAIASVSQTWL